MVKVLDHDITGSEFHHHIPFQTITPGKSIEPYYTTLASGVMALA